IVKADGSNAKIEEKLDFKVIEFSKSAKRIILSHTKTWEDEAKEVEDSKQEPQKAKKMKINLEKTTLGDVTDLAALKEKLEENKKEDN
ncbi:MAG: 30S ribosomal protein S1, partial [Bacteroidales bacterium]